MQDRTITISSCGKTFGFTGWKIGYAMAKKEFIEAIHGVHQWTTFAVNTPGQHSMAQAFQRLDEYLPSFKQLYEQKRNFVYNELLNSKFTKMISIDETKHIAGLSRIGATEKDLDKFSHDLSAILDWMKQLDEVNLEGVEPTAHVSGVKNIFVPSR